MRHRFALLSWTAGLAAAVAAISFMASAPADAAGRNCRSETKTTYKRVCIRERTRLHQSGRTWAARTPTYGGVKCQNKPVTRTVLICDVVPAVPRAPKPGRRPIRAK